MTKLIFQIGLTDVEDSDAFVYNEGTTISENNAEYNLYRQTTDIEKDMIEFEIQTQIPAVLKAIDAWEDTIKAPHLTMIGYHKDPSYLHPDYKNTIIDIQFMSLLPYPDDYFSLLTDEDYKHFEIQDGNFGTIWFNMNMIYEQANVDYETTFNWCYSHDEMENYDKDHGRPVAAPFLRLEFLMAQQRSKIAHERNLKQFLKDFEQQMEELQIDTSSPAMAIGELPFAKLIGNSREAYMKTQQYSRVCRTSIKKID
jgi:hypothetical protein